MTVKELIKKLKKMPGETLVVIDDVDTNWDFHVKDIVLGIDGVARIWSDYDNHYKVW